MNGVKPPRLRTISEAVAEIRSADPETALTAYRIRQLVLNGTLPKIQAGKKYLINLDMLFEFLNVNTITKAEKNADKTDNSVYENIISRID